MPMRGEYQLSEWGQRAEASLLEALSDVRDGLDAIPKVTAALAYLRIEAGELSEDEAPQPD